MKATRYLWGIALLASLGSYLWALTLPAIHSSDGYLIGGATLAFGWMQVVNLTSLAWLANPLYGLAIKYTWRNEHLVAAMLLALAALVGVDTFRLESYHDGTRSDLVAVQSVGIAFYVWQLSFLLLLTANAIAAAFKRRATEISQS